MKTYLYKQRNPIRQRNWILALLFGERRTCEYHRWSSNTTTISQCHFCGLERKLIGHWVIRDHKGEETGELRYDPKLEAQELLYWTKDGWTVEMPKTLNYL